jgi:dihydrofolate reductase
MSKLILFNMMTVDGFFEGLNRELDWHKVDDDFNEFAIEQLNNASLLIFGRVTYELMASYWPAEGAIADDPVIASKMNSLPKIVFSETLKKAEWNNTRLVKDDPVKECRRLKDKYDKDIYVFGSANLAAELKHEGVIDEYRIIISPIILGNGNPLFKPSRNKLKLKLIRTKTFRNGNVLLCYEPDQE